MSDDRRVAFERSNATLDFDRLLDVAEVLYVRGLITGAVALDAELPTTATDLVPTALKGLYQEARASAAGRNMRKRDVAAEIASGIRFQLPTEWRQRPEWTAFFARISHLRSVDTPGGRDDHAD